MGPEGIGKLSLLRQVLEARAAGEPVPQDWCYVHNFADPRRPRAICLPTGEGRRFRDRIAQLERELQTAIPAAFESDEYRNRREALEASLKERREAALMDFERLAAGKGLALLRTPVGVGLAPLHDGKVLDRDQVAALPEEERRRLAEASGELEAKLGDLVQRQFPAWERETRTAIRETGQEVARRAVGHLIDEVRAGHADHEEIVRAPRRARGGRRRERRGVPRGRPAPGAAVAAGGAPRGRGAVPAATASTCWWTTPTRRARRSSSRTCRRSPTCSAVSSTPHTWARWSPTSR